MGAACRSAMAETPSTSMRSRLLGSKLHRGDASLTTEYISEMETLHEAIRNLCQSCDVKDCLLRIDHRRADDAHIAIDIEAAKVGIMKARRSSEVHMPERSHSRVIRV
jgi:hypothetical protein